MAGNWIKMTMNRDAMMDDGDLEERVVYYDLENGARALGLHSDTDASGAPSRAIRQRQRNSATERILSAPKDLFTSQHPAFSGSLIEIDASSGEENEADDDAEDNPFSVLLQPAPARKSQPERTRKSPVKHLPHSQTPSPEAPDERNAPTRRVSTATHAPVRETTAFVSRMTSILPRDGARSIAQVTAPATRKALGPAFEAADARPARWARAVPAPKRRLSSNAVHSQATQQSSGKRRKSMPLTVSSLDAEWNSVPLGGGRRLSEVLSKATSLSQRRPAEVEQAVTKMIAETTTEMRRETDDGIADTVHELRDEPFQTQFFSPSKLRHGHAHRKPRADALLAKIRGSIGDAIRKATRRNNRDLTLLRSHGQTLLRNEAQGSADELQQRDFMVMRIVRPATHAHHLAYEAVVVELSTGSEARLLGALPGMKLIALFPAEDSTSSDHRFDRGACVKVLAPFQVVIENFVPGRRRRAKHFLTSTSLFEVMDRET